MAKQHIWITNPSNLCPDLKNEDEIMECVTSIIKYITKGKTIATKVPQLIMPIGPPGAGKSTITKNLVLLHSDVDINNYVEFDADNLLDYLKSSSSNLTINNSLQNSVMSNIKNLSDINGKKTKIGYAYGWVECMSKLSPKLIYLIISRLLKSNYNLILNVHNYELIIDAQLNGYFCILVYVAVSKNIAVKRSNDRAFETGRFLPEGWEHSVDWYLKEYKEKAVWYALWSDRFVIVNNNKNNYYPNAKDFKILITHPISSNSNSNFNSNSKNITKKNKIISSTNWRSHVKKMYSAINKQS